MKYKLLLCASLLATVLFSCKKDENRLYFQGGTPPVLKASSTSDLVLRDANKANTALTLSWTNPDYQFSNGVSSQDVNYTLQVDTTGANFTSPLKQEVAISKDLSVTYTVKDLNTILTKLNLNEDMPHNVEFRVKASMGTNGAVPLFSNVVKIKITPYLDVALPLPPTGDLYFTGDGMPSGWTNNPPAAQKLTQVSKTMYEGTAHFKPGFYYKFLSNLGQWQPQYGGSSATGGELGYRMGSSGNDPDAIPTPAVEGDYKVTLNFKTGRYTVEKI